MTASAVKLSPTREGAGSAFAQPQGSCPWLAVPQRVPSKGPQPVLTDCCLTEGTPAGPPACPEHWLPVLRARWAASQDTPASTHSQEDGCHLPHAGLPARRRLGEACRLDRRAWNRRPLSTGAGPGSHHLHPATPGGQAPWFMRCPQKPRCDTRQGLRYESPNNQWVNR